MVGDWIWRVLLCSGVHWSCTLIALKEPRNRPSTIAVLVVCRKSKVHLFLDCAPCLPGLA